MGNMWSWVLFYIGCIGNQRKLDIKLTKRNTILLKKSSSVLLPDFGLIWKTTDCNVIGDSLEKFSFFIIVFISSTENII